MFRIEAPYPARASVIILPSPQMGNNLGLQSDVQIIRMEDGSRRSFIKRVAGRKRHQWNFVLSYHKMEELQDFVVRYRGSRFLVDWRGERIIGHLVLNPTEFRGAGRAVGLPGDEAYTTVLELVE